MNRRIRVFDIRGIVVTTIFLMASLAPAAAEQGKVPESQARAALRLSPRREATSWLLDTREMGVAYRWHLSLPEGRTVHRYAVAIHGGRAGLFLIDAKGRLVDPGEARAGIESLFLAANSRKDAPGALARALDVLAPADSSCYYPGYTALDFAYARQAVPGELPMREVPLASRELDFLLPSPDLVDPQGPAQILIVLDGGEKAGADCLLITTEIEYFEGEREFYAKTPEYRSQSYAKKALALMSSNFDDDVASKKSFQTAAQAAYPGLDMAAKDWDIFEGDPELKALLMRSGTDFLNSMMGARDFQDGEPITPALDSIDWFEGLYGKNRQACVASYIEYCFLNGLPIFISDLERTYKGYSSTNYRPISAAEGVELAHLALRFFTWGLEYNGARNESVAVMEISVQDKRRVEAWIRSGCRKKSRGINYLPVDPLPLAPGALPSFNGIPNDWWRDLNPDSPFSEGTAGYPLPVRTNALTPQAFAKAMVAEAKGIALKTLSPPVDAGVDPLGLLSAALSMTSYSSNVVDAEGKRITDKLDKALVSGKKPDTDSRLYRVDLENITLTIPDLRLLRPGDLVYRCGSEKTDQQDPTELGIVLYVPTMEAPLPGQDPQSFLSHVLILGAKAGGEQRVVILPYLAAAPGKDYSGGKCYQFRRLILHK